MVRRLRRRLVLLPEMLVNIMAPRWVRILHQEQDIQTGLQFVQSGGEEATCKV